MYKDLSKYILNTSIFHKVIFYIRKVSVKFVMGSNYKQQIYNIK